MLKVFIADGQPSRSFGVRLLLAGSAEVVGEAHTAERVVESVAATAPDVVVLDPLIASHAEASVFIGLALKLNCGLAPPKVLLYADEDELHGTDARELVAASGAEGFCDVRLGLGRLRDAVGRVGRGETVLVRLSEGRVGD